MACHFAFKLLTKLLFFSNDQELLVTAASLTLVPQPSLAAPAREAVPGRVALKWTSNWVSNYSCQRCDPNQSHRDVVRTWKCAQAFLGLLGAPPYHMSFVLQVQKMRMG